MFNMGAPIRTYWTVNVPYYFDRPRSERQPLRNADREKLAAAGFKDGVRFPSEWEAEREAKAIREQTGVPVTVNETSPL